MVANKPVQDNKKLAKEKIIQRMLQDNGEGVDMIVRDRELQKILLS